MTRFSELLLDVYRLTASEPATRFQEAALSAAHRFLEFDSALWSCGIVTPEGPLMHAVHLHRQPADLMQSWPHIRRLDELNAEAMRHAGKTMLANNVGLSGGNKPDPEISAHYRRYGMTHLMTTVSLDPVSRLFNTISMHRTDPARPYSEADRQIKQNLTPHLALAWEMSLLAWTKAGSQPSERLPAGDSMALAVCDHLGMLHIASPGFSALIRREWPDWHGPYLVCAPLTNPGRLITGRKIVVDSEPNHGRWLLVGREISARDRLSQRELEVAKRFSDGSSYQVVAHALHISPSTVRNHLKNVYAKLGVGNKVELAKLLHR